MACHPENFMPRMAWEIGPSYRNGALASSITLGGQSEQDGSGSSHGRPHASHHGAVMTATRCVHDPHSGHPPAPHAAHVGGSSRSRSPDTEAEKVDRAADMLRGTSRPSLNTDSRSQDDRML